MMVMNLFLRCLKGGDIEKPRGGLKQFHFFHLRHENYGRFKAKAATNIFFWMGWINRQLVWDPFSCVCLKLFLFHVLPY